MRAAAAIKQGQVLRSVSAIGAVVTLLTCVVTPGHATVSRDQYPIRDPFVATLTARLLRPSSSPQQFSRPPLRGRESTPILGARLALPISAYIQPRPAPLAFVIPGIGGDANDSMAIALAERWYAEGYSSIVVASPVNWRFAAGQSSTSIFGYGPADAQDLYRVMQQAKSAAEVSLGLRATSVAVTGYSLGALNTAQVKAIDRVERRLGIGKIVLLNPPLDLDYATAQLDRFDAIGSSWSQSERDALWGRAYRVAEEVLAQGGSAQSLQAVARAFRSDQAAYLFGKAARDSLSAAIFASQQANDLGLLGAPATFSEMNAREARAARFGFAQWQRSGAIPFWSARTGLSAAGLVQRSSWSAVAAAVIADAQAHVIHSSDDPLVRAQDLSRLQGSMGARARIIDGGGHCGAYWHPVFTAALAAAIRAR